MSIKNVIIIGAGGNLGPHIVSALSADPTFAVSILTRQSSTSTFPADVKVHTVPDSYPVDKLVEAFKGQDAVVSTISATGTGLQAQFIDAALKAGVKRFMPAEYGSDAQNPRTWELLPIFQRKIDVVEQLKKTEGQMSWTGVVTGVFFDWAMKVGFLGIDLQGYKATIYDSGDSQFSTTTLPTIAQAVRGVLHHPEETANQYVYVASFTTSQNEIIRTLEQTTGKKLEIQHASTAEFEKTGKEKLSKGDPSAMFDLITASLFEGTRGADHGNVRTLGNELLGLPKETLEGAIKALL